MKPLKLHMKNIGPYRDETIDFTKLDNMFLIKGDTGAGKTFIFDSMTFAPYGQLRGNRKGHESDLKSRYAEENDDSFVEFTFEIGGKANNGKTYKINRTVPFSITNRNGKVTKKISEASLQEQNQGSGNFSAIPGKLTEINEKIAQTENHKKAIQERIDSINEELDGAEGAIHEKEKQLDGQMNLMDYQTGENKFEITKD